jgi:hypothetical protein
MSPISPQYRAREIARYTCLRAFAGRQSIKSGVFDATSLNLQTLTPPAPYVTIYGAQGVQEFFVPIGSLLTKSTTDPTKVKVYQGLGANANAVQTLTETGTPTGGTFTLSYGGQTTAPIPFNASAAQVASALQALSSIGSSANLTTAGGPFPGSAITVTFGGLLGNQPQPVMTANSAGLTGGATPTVTPTVTTAGSTAESIVGVFDGPDRDFFGNTNVGYDEPIPIYFHSCSFDISKIQNWAQYGAAAMAALPSCTFF